ncbi:MAG: hypothetical protein PHT54_03545 [Candidatus Nanoarchaeia archaeon]|nr:hypothetical protein [Candidatus Nanoarchaeia archaeon]
MIFLEFYEILTSKLAFEKQHEILSKIKRDIPFSDENIIKEGNSKGNIGGEIIDTKLMDDGTIRTYVKEKKEPLTSYADSETVNSITAYKHLFILILKNFNKQNLFGKVIILIYLYLNKQVFIEYSERFFKLFRMLLKDEYWSNPIKEIRRVLKVKFNPIVIDIISLILEYDSAYKNRVQDVLPLLDKSKLKGFSAIKEVSRLVDILIERDYEEMRNEKWRPLKKITKMVMLLPKIRKEIIAILKDIDLDKIAFTKEDLYWIRQFPSYKWLGKNTSENLKDNIRIYGGEY